MMKSHMKIMFCCLQLLLIVLLAAWPVLAEKTPQKAIVLPSGALNAEQIDAQFRGMSTKADVGEKQVLEVYYFNKNGKVTEVRNGFQKSGKWYVRSDGRLCIDLKGEHRDCRMIVKEQNFYNQYAVKRSGNHRYEQTYYDFHAGDQLQKMSPKPVLPKGTLKRKAVIKLFSGKTVESVTASKGRASLSYYNPDGTIEQVRDGVTRTGKWRVNKNSRMCLQLEGSKEKCRIIVKEKKEYKKYIVKKNGKHKHSVTYSKFFKGNHL